VPNACYLGENIDIYIYLSIYLSFAVFLSLSAQCPLRGVTVQITHNLFFYHSFRVSVSVRFGMCYVQGKNNNNNSVSHLSDSSHPSPHSLFSFVLDEYCWFYRALIFVVGLNVLCKILHIPLQFLCSHPKCAHTCIKPLLSVFRCLFCLNSKIHAK